MFDFKTLVSSLLTKNTPSSSVAQSATMLVRDLPEAEYFSAVVEIVKAVAKINADTDLPLKERLKTLLYVDERAHGIHDRLCREYLRNEANTRGFLPTILAYWHELANAYQICLRVHAGAPSGGLDEDIRLATVRGVPNEPGMAAKVFTELAAAGVNVDMIVQAGASVGTAEISFTVPESTVKEVENVLIDKHDELGYKSFDINRSVGKVAVVGVGMKTHSGLAAKFFTALSDKGINVLMISTSEIRIAALVPLDQLDDAVRALHTAYGLDADQVEAVVYGGTGR